MADLKYLFLWQVKSHMSERKSSMNQESKQEIILAPSNILKAAKSKSLFADILGILQDTCHFCLLNSSLESTCSPPNMC